MKTVIDGDGAILGRVGSMAAKRLLKGEEVVIINAEKVIISGDRKVIVDKIIDLRKKGGASLKGPKVSSLPDMLLKRKIRGMLPWDRQKGRDAYKRLRCFVGEQALEKLDQTEKDKIIKLNQKRPRKFLTLSRVTELI
jgi:large subunit ribosomal protein L13